MIKVTETRLPFAGVRSLVWEGDTLVDWADGGRRCDLGGGVSDRQVRYGPIFDAATSSPSGEYTVIYTRLGTKGLILRNGRPVREINRSYYQSEAYEFPIVLLRLKNGREAIVHCPDEYNRLEIDDLETGVRLTQDDGRAPVDFFHSRLDVSPDGNVLISAGWLWQPVDDVRMYNLATALADPRSLDAGEMAMVAWADNSSAAFLADGSLVVALDGIEDIDEDGTITENDRAELRIFDLRSDELPRLVPLDGKPGTIVGVGPDHILSLYEFPQLIELASGAVIRRWPHIRSGAQRSSILLGIEPPPPLAFDRTGQRLAVADADGITVLAFFSL
jgi:hypothetical protein